MSCIATTTRVSVSVKRPSVSKISHQHTGSSSIINQPTRTLPIHSTLPVPKSVFVTTRTSSSQGMHSTTNSKKRSRSQGLKESIVIPIAHGFTRTVPIIPAKPVAGTFAPIQTREFKQSCKSVDKASANGNENGNTDCELTKEQIDDMIDTTLPTNFSFSLPVKQLSPKPSQPSHDPIPKDKKQRYSHPPMPVVQTEKQSSEILANSHFSTAVISEEVTSSSAFVSKKTPSQGRWTKKEHEAFLEGLNIYGREWKKVALRISTRTSAQIRSHAQKYFSKLARDQEAQAASLHSHHVSSVVTSTNDMSPIKDEIKNEYPPSVRLRVAKILKDPKGAEAEVAETLRRLRQRYDELHNTMRIEEVQEVPANTIDSTQGQIHYKSPTQFTFAAAPSENVVESHEQDVTSTMRPLYTFSPLRAGRSNLCLSDESLELHSKELIALTVLGGELYRSASNQDLCRAASSLPQAVGAETGSEIHNLQSETLAVALQTLHAKGSSSKSDTDSN
jgi:SHAQKYF class myb-like DNA-binding protein